MATRYGFEVLAWLLERGWSKDKLDDDIIGDQHVIDPKTGKTMDVYNAAKLHNERTGEYPSCLNAEDGGN